MIKIATNLFFKNITPTLKALPALKPYLFSTQKPNSPFENSNPSSSPFTQSENDIQTRNIVAKNIGMKRFVTRMYNATALSICGALASTYVGMSIPALMMNPMATALVGGLVTIGSFIGMQAIQPILVTENIPGSPAPVYRTQNPISRLALYGLGVASLGLSASPLFAYMSAMNPSVITSALGITMGIFGGASLGAYMMPKDKMLGYGNIFMGGLIGLIGMQLVGLGSAYFMGPNALSTLLFSVNNYAGILLFSGLIAYDTHVAIKQYEMGFADHLGVSVQMLLNFWNIMLRVMQILNQFKE